MTPQLRTVAIDLAKNVFHLVGADTTGTSLWRTRLTRQALTTLAKTSWLFGTFGEHQVMGQLIAKRVLISPLIHKGFPVCHLLLARGNFASVNLNHQK